MGHLLQPFVLVQFLSVAALGQTTWYVDASSTPPGDGSANWPYSSIQYAVDQSTTVEYDWLDIAQGVYAENVHVTGKTLNLTGNGGPYGTIIDGQGVGSCLSFTDMPVASGSSESWVTELTFVGGAGTATPTGTAGGAVYCADWDGQFIFRDCIFLDNTSPYGSGVGRGGALYAVNCYRINMSYCGLIGNVAEGGDGQAVYVVDCEQGLYLYACDFVANGDPLVPAGNGGAIYSEESDVYVSESVFAANICGGNGGAIYSFNAYVETDHSEFVDNRAGGYGGATACTNHFGARLISYGDRFEGNRSTGGGAIYVGGIFGVVDRGEFKDNVASSQGPEEGYGGAIFFTQAGAGNQRIWHSTFEDNAALGNASLDGRGGAIYGSAGLYHCTLTTNYAEGPGAEGGAYFGGGQLDSCIVWENGPDDVAGGVSAVWSDVAGGWPGTGNIDADPMFGAHLSLQPGSPCIDTGNPIRNDLDGTRADMGAHAWEWVSVGTRYCATGVNSTGLEARIDARGSTSVNANFLVLEATQAPSGTSGIFLASRTQAYVPYVGGGQGTLCLGSPLVRFLDIVVSTDAIGRAELQLDFGDLPPGVVFVSGDVWNFQFLFRDANPTTTTNLTDGVTVRLTH